MAQNEHYAAQAADEPAGKSRQAKLKDLANRRQHLVRAAELETLGWSRPTIYRRARPGGVWQRVLPGIIALFTGGLDQRQRILGALRYTGAGAVITGLTSLRLAGVRGVPYDANVYLLIPQRRKRLSKDFAIIERTWRLPRHRWIEGIPCAPVARSAIDACRRIRDLDLVRTIIAEVVQRGMCTVEDLVVELAQAQCRGTALPRRVLREVMAGIRSVAEAKAREILRKAGLPEPKWNHDLFDADGNWVASPDAVWEELGVVLEIDSRAWHLGPDRYYRTQARQRRMGKMGLIVIPVSPAVLLANPEAIIDEIRQTLENAANRPTPRFTLRPRSS